MVSALRELESWLVHVQDKHEYFCTSTMVRRWVGLALDYVV